MKKITFLPFRVTVSKNNDSIEIGSFSDFLQAFQFACVVSKQFSGITHVVYVDESESMTIVSTLTSNLFKDAVK